VTFRNILAGRVLVSAVVDEQPLDAGSSDVSMTDIYIIQDNNENSSNEPILSRDAAMDVRRMKRVLSRHPLRENSEFQDLIRSWMKQ
jgi:hypothetical protein